MSQTNSPLQGSRDQKLSNRSGGGGSEGGGSAGGSSEGSGFASGVGTRVCDVSLYTLPVRLGTILAGLLVAR